MWIGPAPFRAYNPAYHPWIWRCWWDFGSGTVGDMGCHAMHVFYKALELGRAASDPGCSHHHVRRVLPHGPDGRETLPPKIETPETESYSNIITWDFPERGKHPALQMIWYDGGHASAPAHRTGPGTPMPVEGLLFIGEKGKLLSGYYGGKNRLLPEKQFRDFQPPPKTLKRTIGHYKEWVWPVKLARPTNVNFEFGSRMTQIAQLGAMAARCAQTVVWDAENMAITNDAEANTLGQSALSCGMGAVVLKKISFAGASVPFSAACTVVSGMAEDRQ